MKKFYLIALLVFGGALTLLISCKKEFASNVNYGLRPLPGSPKLPSQPYSYPSGNNDLVTLGRVLFYDKNLSADGSVSCASCHRQEYGFADNKAFSTGSNSSQTLRNAHAIVNVNNSRFWDGKAVNYMQAVAVPFQSHLELNMDMNAVCEKLANIPYYQYLFMKALPYCSNTITPNGLEQALGAFLFNIKAENTAYDQAFPPAGSGIQASGSLTQEELNGMAIFNGKGKCNLCHDPTNGFGGNLDQYEDIGLDSVYSDPGRAGITALAVDQGRFHVPSLRNVALTAPYMHDGRFKTLEEVVDFFSNGVKNSPNLSSALSGHPVLTNDSYTTGATFFPIPLNVDEKKNLVAFLKTLTDYSLVNDIRYSDPFK
jgi:cytochrome c peroxidase